MVLFRLICDYFKSKNWNILFFYSLRGICERKYTLPAVVFGGPKKEKQRIEELEKDIEEANTLIGKKERDIEFLKKNLRKLGLL